MAWSTMEQLRALRTDAQRAAVRREGHVLDEKYPGQHVAYTDDWNGEELVRTVVAVTPDPDEFQRLLAALAPDIRRRIQMTHVPPADLISIPGTELL